MLLALAALPALLWEGAPDTAPALRAAGVTEIRVPASRVDAWRGVAGISVIGAQLEAAIKLLTPTVNYKMDEATASRAPWLASNGWQYIRKPAAEFSYDVPGKGAALAAAEAFVYGGNATVRTDAAGLKPFTEMLAFLRSVTRNTGPALADIGFQDDGTPAAGEVMNLMVRDNLLFRIVPGPDKSLKLNVRLGAKEYPIADAKNPKLLAQSIRTNLTDEKRSLRLYGSLVVVGHITQSAAGVQLHLLNYAGADRQVNGLRVRVLGRYPKHRVATAGSPGQELLDYTADPDATEFTLPELKTYSVIDLSR